MEGAPATGHCPLGRLVLRYKNVCKRDLQVTGINPDSWELLAVAGTELFDKRSRGVNQSATAGDLEKTQAAVTAGPGDKSTLFHPLRKRLLCKNRVAEPLQRLLSAMVLTRSFEMHSCLHLPLTMIAYEDGYFRLTSAPFSPGGPAAPGAPRGPCKKSVNRLPD